MIEFFQSNATAQKALISIVLVLINIVSVQIMSKILFKAIKETSTYYNLRKRFYYLFTVIMLIMIYFVWSESNNNLMTYMGFISAGIAIALREIFTNIAAWFIIVFQKPFDVFAKSFRRFCSSL